MIIFGVKKFHQYLAGREFEIFTDHKPLVYLFGEHKGVPTLASCRIHRWALILGSYNYSVKYRSGQELANADALSRLPIPSTEEPSSPPAELIALVNHLESIPLTVTDLSRVVNLVRRGWPENVSDVPSDCISYYRHQTELSILDGVCCEEHKSSFQPS